MKLKLADIIEALTGTMPNNADHAIVEAVVDSRKVSAGAMFVAMRGEQVDGHDYVVEAIENGALVALVEREINLGYNSIDLRNKNLLQDNRELKVPVLIIVNDTTKALQDIARSWRRKLNIDIIGITGSVGKTTTKEVTAEVLGQRYKTLKNQGNFNNEIGLPLSILSLNSSHEKAVLEMGFYVEGEIKLLCDIALPKVGVVTNIGMVHAERAGSQELIAKGKAELVQALPTDGVAILNYDDPLVRAMSENTQASVFYYGLSPEANLWADEIEGLGLDGVRFKLHYQDEIMSLRVPMIGRHSVQTALRAIAVGLAEDLDWEEIIAGLRHGHKQLRLVAVKAENGALLLDDTYNASPQSAIAAINLLDELPGRKIAVLGDMLELGMYERQGHEMVGIRSAEVVDELITVGERSKVIAQAAEDAGLSPAMITRLSSSDEAIELMRNKLGKDDVVLVKGSRGMQMDNIVPSLEKPE